MARSFLPSITRAVASVLCAAGLAACGATMDVKQKTVEGTVAVRQGPEAPPYRSITGFSSALRCMDTLMIDYGVRDISMLVEEIADQTKKVNAGTRDMLITALSDMTRRSRAVRVVAFGKDASTAISFLAQAKREGAYEALPQYDIKGSITQFDENVIRNQRDAGVGMQPFVNLGISRDAAASVVGLDLSMLTTADLSLMAGVTSRNSVVILKQGRGLDADAAISKFGVNYTLNLSKSEGQSQAVRSLVELAAIELIGKLTKTPYWSCLGGDAARNDEIRLEMADWFHAMASSGVELIAWYQYQLRRRGFYDGPIDGAFNPALDEAIAAYREALGLERRALLDPAFFMAYLGADHAKIPRPAQPARAQAAPAPAPAATPAAGAVPAASAGSAAPALKLAVASVRHQTRFAPGEPVNLLLQPSRDAHVYCWLQDEKGRILRMFPNRFTRDSLVPAARPLALPGTGKFQIVMSARGARETVACFASGRDLAAALPAEVFGADFEPLNLSSLAQVRDAFARVAGSDLAIGVLHVETR